MTNYWAVDVVISTGTVGDLVPIIAGSAEEAQRKAIDSTPAWMVRILSCEPIPEAQYRAMLVVPPIPELPAHLTSPTGPFAVEPLP